MANLTIPNPDVKLGTCPQCGGVTKIDPIWYQQLLALVRYVNANDGVVIGAPAGANKGAGTLNLDNALYKDGVQVVSAQGTAVANASGGATIDAEARTAINALLARMRAHGLIAT